jgi:glutathione reductase (NADPH)
LEFGHVYARAGVKVTILEVLPRLLPALDSDAVAVLQRESERIGIEIATAVHIDRIEEAHGRKRVMFTNSQGENAVDASWVVNGAGRVANVEQLDLAAGKVDHSAGRIETDKFLRSMSNRNVYICGDAVANSPQLSPVATYEGNIVGRNIVEGPTHRPD